jgi:hypothetical protein
MPIASRWHSWQQVALPAQWRDTLPALFVARCSLLRARTLKSCLWLSCPIWCLFGLWQAFMTPATALPVCRLSWVLLALLALPVLLLQCSGSS